MQHFIFFLVSAFMGLNGVSAQGSNLALICKVSDTDFSATYSLTHSGHASLVGHVNQSKFSCDLTLQAVKDGRLGRGTAQYRVQALRTDAKCNHDLSFDLKRGLEEHVDVIISKGYAEIYLFEGYNQIRCEVFEHNEQKLLELSKTLSQRKVNSLSAKRKTVPLKIKSLQKKQVKR